jgi:hypothetical protein
MEARVTRPAYRLGDGIVGGLLGGTVMAIIVGLGSLVLGYAFTYPFALMGYAFEPYSGSVDMSNTTILKGVGLLLGLCMVCGAIYCGIANLLAIARNNWLWGTLFGLACWGIARAAAPQVNPTMYAHWNMMVSGIGFAVYGLCLGAYMDARRKILVKGTVRTVRRDAVIKRDAVVRNDAVLDDERIVITKDGVINNNVPVNNRVINRDTVLDKDRRTVYTDSEVHSDEFEHVD